MPKIRDLGINVIPGTMRPPEVGPGGGGGDGDCQGATHEDCPAGTLQQTLGGGCYGDAKPCPAGTLNQTDGGTCYGDVPPCTAGTLQQTDGGTCYDDPAPCTAGTLEQTLGGTCYGDPAQCPAGTHADSPQLVHMAAAQTGQPAAAGLTREAIALLKQQLQDQTQLDEIAKSIAPKTTEEIDAREQQLKAELEELANLRNRLETEK